MQLGSSLIDQTFAVCDDLEYDVIMGMDMIFSNKIAMEMMSNGVGLRLNGELIKSQWHEEKDDIRRREVKISAIAQCDELRDVMHDEFKGSFTRNGEQLRQTSRFKHEVEVFGPPIKQGHYNQSPRNRQILRRIVQQMVRYGMAEKVENSEYGHPAFIFGKG